jgi:hypothetical protein
MNKKKERPQMSEVKTPVENKDYSAFTYQVTMIVTVFGENEEKAKASLDENGGFVSHRSVELKDAIPIYSVEK